MKFLAIIMSLICIAPMISQAQDENGKTVFEGAAFDLAPKSLEVALAPFYLSYGNGPIENVVGERNCMSDWYLTIFIRAMQNRVLVENGKDILRRCLGKPNKVDCGHGFPTAGIYIVDQKLISLRHLSRWVVPKGNGAYTLNSRDDLYFLTILHLKFGEETATISLRPITSSHSNMRDVMSNGVWGSYEWKAIVDADYNFAEAAKPLCEVKIPMNVTYPEAKTLQINGK